LERLIEKTSPRFCFSSSSVASWLAFKWFHMHFDILKSAKSGIAPRRRRRYSLDIITGSSTTSDCCSCLEIVISHEACLFYLDAILFITRAQRPIFSPLPLFKSENPFYSETVRPVSPESEGPDWLKSNFPV
jgi:hypothetical protein